MVWLAAWMDAARPQCALCGHVADAAVAMRVAVRREEDLAMGMGVVEAAEVFREPASRARPVGDAQKRK